MFQYYFPRENYATLSRDVVCAAGLGDVFRDVLSSAAAFDAGITKRQVQNGGPDGGHGVIIAIEQHGTRQVGYFGVLQNWQEKCGYWLGSHKGDLPRPEELARPHGSGFTPGIAVMLGDGNYWEVPTIRERGSMATLPRRMGLNSTGKFELSVLPDYDFAWAASGRIFDLVFGNQRVNWQEAFSLCVQVLNLNYRVSEAEASALGLVTTENFQEIFKAAIDWAKVAELLSLDDAADDQKKRPVVPAANSSRSLPAD